MPETTSLIKWLGYTLPPKRWGKRLELVHALLVKELPLVFTPLTSAVPVLEPFVPVTSMLSSVVGLLFRCLYR